MINLTNRFLLYTSLFALLVLVRADYQDGENSFIYAEPSNLDFYFRTNDRDTFDDEDVNPGLEYNLGNKIVQKSRSPDPQAVTLVPLNPEAEMLPANYVGVKPPGVDHMEMRMPAETKFAPKLRPVTIEEALGYHKKLAEVRKIAEKDKAEKVSPDSS